MRSATLTALLFVVLFYLLRFPGEVFQASASGVTLWFFHVLPSLLPFMIFSDLLIHSGLAFSFLKRINGCFRFLFGLSAYGTYALFLGLFCGYPMGAKLTADLLREQKISLREAQYLLTFCNSPSPAFITSYLLLDTLHLSHASGYTFLILYLSLFLTSLFFRLCLKPDAAGEFFPMTVSAGTVKQSFSYLIDHSIMQAFETVTKLGGYIILFSILASLIQKATASVPVLSLLLTGLTEMTTGISLIGNSPLPLTVRYLAVLVAAAFGGLSCIAQTRGMLHGTPLKIHTYIAGKIVHAVCTLLIGWLLLFIQSFQ